MIDGATLLKVISLRCTEVRDAESFSDSDPSLSFSVSVMINSSVPSSSLTMFDAIYSTAVKFV